MARNIPAGVATEIAKFQNTSEFLVEVHYETTGGSDEIVRFTTASQDIVTSSVDEIPDATWVGIGFPDGDSGFSIGSTSETRDARAQSMDISLNGVDTSFVAILQNNFFRGRPLNVWRIYLNPNTGAIITGMLVWSGYQLDEYTVNDPGQSDDGVARPVTVSTRVSSKLASIQKTNEVQTSVLSHNLMLERAGLPSGDTGFATVPGVANRTIVWGTQTGRGEVGDSPNRGGRDDR